MCQKPDLKTRRRMAVANGCAAAGLMLQLFVHPASPMPKNLLHVGVGLLLGMSIAVNVLNLRRRKRGDCAGVWSRRLLFLRGK